VRFVHERSIAYMDKRVKYRILAQIRVGTQKGGGKSSEAVTHFSLAGSLSY
jgi:hypothetical protein